MDFYETRLPNWVYILLFIFSGFVLATGLYLFLPLLWHCIIGLGFCILLAYVWIMILI